MFRTAARHSSNLVFLACVSFGPPGIIAEAIPKVQRGSLNVGQGGLASSKPLWGKGL